MSKEQIHIMYSQTFKFYSRKTGRLEEYNTQRSLGQGAFGDTVLIAHPKYPRQKLVVKHVHVTDMPRMMMSKRDTLRKTINELHTLDKMDYLKGYKRSGDHIYMVMKYFPGVPGSHYSDYTEQFAKFSALRDCHRNGFVHFDTHAKNFIYNAADKKATAIDFGLAREFSLFNLFLELKFFFRNEQMTILQKLLYFILEQVIYYKNNPGSFLYNFTWAALVVYGATYGLPLLMIGQQTFLNYLFVLGMHQAFIELRAVGLIKPNHFAQVIFDWYAMFNRSIFSLNRVREVLLSSMPILKHLLKPVYLAAMFIPYKITMRFSPALLEFIKRMSHIKNFIGFRNFIGAKQSMDLALNAGFLIFPAKELAKFLDDSIVKPFEPECITKLRCDLYFQHHPNLYVKSAFAKVGLIEEVDKENMPSINQRFANR